jgi:hypothetical protein
VIGRSTWRTTRHGVTGLLTLGLVADSDFERAVVTDISRAMLAVCEAIVDQTTNDKQSRITLATFSDGEHLSLSNAAQLARFWTALLEPHPVLLLSMQGP